MRTVILYFSALITTIIFIGPAAAQEIEEVTFIVRTMDDPDIPPDMSFCAEAPFPTNVFLGASVWSPKTRANSAETVVDFPNEVGTATACMLFTDLSFPVGGEIPVYALFSLHDGDYTGVGTCTITSNDVPVPGLILTSCGVRVEGPEGYLGGVASTTTVINAYRIPGFNTGSFISIRGYRLAE